MTEIAHAAIDAGADIVMGHGPHYSLPVEMYKGRPIYYGLGNLSFHTGHVGRKHARLGRHGRRGDVRGTASAAPTTFALCVITTGYETYSAGLGGPGRGARRPGRTQQDARRHAHGPRDRVRVARDARRFPEILGSPMDQSGLILAARTTLAHFSVSSAISLPKSAGEPISGNAADVFR